MPTFVHLAPEPIASRIVRNGIRKSAAHKPLPAGVFAMPVARNFYASHQWLRELKRGGQKTIAAIYFRIPDREPVFLGHFGKGHTEMPASEASGYIAAAESAEGFQVLIPRRIEPAEILRSKTLPQVVGWRFYPGAHGRKPCGCPACLGRGEIKSGAIRKRYQDG